MTPLPERFATWKVVQKIELNRPIMRSLSAPHAAACSAASSVTTSPQATQSAESPRPRATLAGMSEAQEGARFAAQ